MFLMRIGFVGVDLHAPFSFAWFDECQHPIHNRCNPLHSPLLDSYWNRLYHPIGMEEWGMEWRRHSPILHNKTPLCEFACTKAVVSEEDKKSSKA